MNETKHFQKQDKNMVTKQTKTDLFSILTMNVDVENKTPDQFKRLLQKIMRDRKTIDALETYVGRKLKPFGITVSRTNLDHHNINEA